MLNAITVLALVVVSFAGQAGSTDVELFGPGVLSTGQVFRGSFTPDGRTFGYDVFPFVSPDGRDLYFVRDFATCHRIALADALASVARRPRLASDREKTAPRPSA